MKRIILAIAFSLIAVFLGIFELVYIESTADELIKNIDEMNDCSENKKQEKAVEILDDSIDKWKCSTIEIDIFLHHDNIEEIAENFQEMKILINSEEKDDFYALAAKTKRQLLCIKEKELPFIENIL
ncbi:MAG: DUF4363 family protein [Ruminococcus sp.]